MLTKIKDVDHYIAIQPKHIQDRLEQLRCTIKAAAPDALEVISYSMPAYKLNGMLLYFAAHKSHIGIYPMPAAIVAFKKELTPFVTAKSTVQFPYYQPMPFALIKKIVKFRVKENLTKAAKRSSIKK
jgi:uncharacterized protein YdhG (YjbR/CyaY superfamily)